MSIEAVEVNSAREIGRRIYDKSLGHRRGFHGEDVDADVWEEVFEDVGTVALAEIAGNAISEDEKASERTSHVVDWQTFTASSELATSGGRECRLRWPRERRILLLGNYSRVHAASRPARWTFIFDGRGTLAARRKLAHLARQRRAGAARTLIRAVVLLAHPEHAVNLA